MLDLGTGGIVEIVLHGALGNSESIASQEAPLLIGDLLLHDDFDGVESEVVFGPHSIDPFEEGDVEFVVAAIVGDGELDAEAIFFELDLEVLLLVDGEGNFDAHFSWGLVPGILVALRVPQDLVPEHVFFAKLDDSSLVEGCLS